MWPFNRKKKKEVQDIPEKKSIGIAEVTPGFNTNQAIFSEWSVERAIAEGYKASTWEYACVTKLADSTSSVPWKVQEQQEQGVWQDVPKSPLQLLLNKPNPWIPWGEMRELITLFLYLGGNALIPKVRANGAVVELGILPPDKVRPVPGRDQLVENYIFSRGDKEIDIPPEDMVHIKFPDPSSLFWGIAPLQAASRAVDTDIEAVKWNKVSLQNRVVPDGMIATKEKLSIDQWQAGRDAIAEFRKENTDPHRFLFMGADADFTAFARTALEMDWLKGRAFTREEICAINGVPPPIIGIYENATLANIETAREIYWLDTMLVYLSGLIEAFNFSLVPDFDSSGNTRIVLDLSKVDALMGLLKKKAELSKIFWSMGVPFDEINQRLDLGFGEFPGSASGWIPANLNPAGVADGSEIE